ncbi:MAG: hypothetical protein K6347_05225, partial [Campylobacterales bacterium]
EICYENNDKGLVSLWGKIQKLYGKEAKEHIVLVFEPTASYGELSTLPFLSRPFLTSKFLNLKKVSGLILVFYRN